jgi:glycosidase
MNLLAPALLAAAMASADSPAARDVSKESARSVAPWVRDGVIYQVFPRNFSAQGGFKGITARLDELRDLGVTILWLMPINPVGKEKSKGTVGSPYAVRDYDAVNPDYGTKDDLKTLVAEAHRRGLKVIVDEVVNHTSWDSVLMKTPEFYTHDKSGHIVPPVADWSDVADLDYGNPRLRSYMTGMLARWLREADLDGFRCDVAGMVPTDFWEGTRRELEKIKPEILMLAESSEPELLVQAFDLDYAWPFHSALTRVLMGDEPASSLRSVWDAERRRYPRGALHMFFSDDHDERRAIARFGERGALAASALVFALDGVPLIYNGMEVGDTTESGAPALFEKMPVFWPIAERRPDFRPFYKGLVALRRAHPALRRGETQWLRSSDDSRVVALLRSDGEERVLVAVNLSNRPWTGIVEAPDPEHLSPVPIDPARAPRPSSLPALSLDAWEARVFASAAR